MASSRFGRLARKPLRHVQRYEESVEKNPPMGTRKISKPEAIRRAMPMLGLIANGHIPLDETTSELVASALDDFAKRRRTR